MEKHNKNSTSDEMSKELQRIADNIIKTIIKEYEHYEKVQRILEENYKDSPSMTSIVIKRPAGFE